MPVINVSGNQTIFLGDQPIVEVRLGNQLLWPAQVTKPPVEIIEVTLPDLNVKSIPNSTLPAFKKKDLTLLDKLGQAELISTAALPLLSGIEIPCEGGTLPTRADIVNEFNKLAQLPSKLKVYIEGQGDELEAQVRDQIEGIISQIEDVMELFGDILSPYWKKGAVRNWQKEADDAWNELIQEYHIFIPTKMLEMISKVIPIGFNVNILGISIDVLKILEEEEQNRIIAQIEAEVDKFHAMIPAEYQQFKGEFGLKCDEWRARCTWQYIKTEIVKWCTNTLFAAFDTLIGKFKEIWDALGLPDLPAPLGFDVEAFIQGEIESAKQKAEQFKADVKNADKLLEKELNDIEQQIRDFDLEAEAYGMVVDQLEGVSLFGMSLLDVIGGSIDETVKMAEKDIDNLIKAARDFAANWQKELLNVWIKKIKPFLDAIGLGKLLDLLTLTLCDVLPLIGVPTSFDVELPV